MKTTIFLYGQEYDGEWPGQSGLNIKMHLLTNKYLYTLNQLKIDGEVTILVQADDIEKATEKDLDFVVKTKDKSDEDKVWDTIIEIANRTK